MLSCPFLQIVPLNTARRRRGEQTRQTHHFAYTSANTKAEKPTTWCSAICVSCGYITNTNDAIRSENTALIQQVATLRVEANYNDIRAVHEKLDRLSSDVASLTQPTHERKSFATVARCKQRSVLMFDDQILRNMNTVTTADNEEVELHKASKATRKTCRPVERRLQKR